MRRIACVLLCGLALPAWAQEESQLGADFRREREEVKASCSGFGFKSLGGCAQVLFTDHPLHIAVGSLAPQNGFGSGVAFVSHWTPNELWRLSWDADAVATPNGSWRAGAYMTAVLTRHKEIVVRTRGAPAAPRSRLAVTEYPVFHVYVQNISLNKITYFGLGQTTSKSARSYFGEGEAIAGANVVWPLWRALNVSLYGEANGRFVDIRGSHGKAAPSIEQLYTEATAPGLTNQPAFAQFGEGIRLRPSFAGGYVRLNYALTLQQFAGGNSMYSFRRLTTDLSHVFPLYRRTRSVFARDFNGPDDCSADVNLHKCPGVSRNLEGSFGFRFVRSESFVSRGHVVPFYFDPTLGGSDLNGNPVLSSYADYRFRGPNAMFLRGSFEHSIYGPLGVSLMLDAGKVALTRSDLDLSHLAHSYSAGLTIRAGGFPMIWLLFAWGGHEGRHTTVMMNNSLLGGSRRPLLY